MAKPTLGRIVHYRPFGYPTVKKRAAIVTDVNDDGTIDVYAFGGHGNVTQLHVSEAESDTDSNVWEWPARE